MRRLLLAIAMLAIVVIPVEAQESEDIYLPVVLSEGSPQAGQEQVHPPTPARQRILRQSLGDRHLGRPVQKSQRTLRSERR